MKLPIPLYLIFAFVFCFCNNNLLAQEKTPQIKASLQNKEELKKMTVVDSLEGVLKTSKQDTNRVNILNDVSARLINIGDYEKAINYYCNQKCWPKN